ncbi:Ig-like domain-containing protein [Clostridium sp.]|uniref:Ig-like domain-containing protein n=1 Tax=Clostridium sp. TaxID=1506 RepID=UPI003D6D4E26
MKQKKRFLGFFLVLTMMSSQIITTSVQAATTSNPTSKIDLNKTVEKNQWGLNEEFTVNYTIQPRDIPQSLVPEELYHKNGADISLVIDKSGSMAWNLAGEHDYYGNPNLKTTTSYVEDTNGEYIRFSNGKVSYYGTYYYAYSSWWGWGSKTQYISYESNSYETLIDSTGKYIVFKNKKYYLDLQKSYKQVNTMEKSRMQIVREAANSFVDKFKNYSNVRIGLIDYSSTANVENLLLGQLEFSTVKSNIDAIMPNGGTNIGDGLRKAYWQLKDGSSADKKKFLVLLTDGTPNLRSYKSNKNQRISVADNSISGYSTDGDGNADVGNYGFDYAKYIAGIVGADKTNNALNINPFMIAFSTDATSNKLSDISNVASNNQAGYYYEAKSIEDINQVYENIAKTVLSDLSIYGLKLEETFPSGISIVDKSNGLKIDSSNGQKIIGDIGNINYTLDTVNHIFKADPITFWVNLKGTATGDYVLGKNATGNSTSFVSYKDIDGKDVSPSPSFPPININIYNNKPPMVEAMLTDGANKDNYNLSVKVDKPSNIVVKASKDDSTSIATQNNVNDAITGNMYTYTLPIPTSTVKSNIYKNIYTLSLEASDKENLKTVETVPLISTQFITEQTNNSKNSFLIKTEINSTIKEIKVNGNIILTNKVTDSDGKYTCDTRNLVDGDNVVSVTVVNSYNNITQTTTNFNVDKMQPATPVITTPKDKTTTDKNKPTIAGTGEPGATVTVYDGTNSIGTVTVASDGNWSLVPIDALTDGDHIIKATQSDVAGNVSGESNKVSLTVDTTIISIINHGMFLNGVVNDKSPYLIVKGFSGNFGVEYKTSIKNAKIQIKVDNECTISDFKFYKIVGAGQPIYVSNLAVPSKSGIFSIAMPDDSTHFILAYKGTVNKNATEGDILTNSIIVGNSKESFCKIKVVKLPILQ